MKHSANQALPLEDASLFEKMVGNSTTEAERLFFANLRQRELRVFTNDGEMIISENDNADGFYLCRYYFSEYSLGNRDHRGAYAVSLAEILSKNLKDCAMCEEDITLWQWLRARDYEPVRYDNYLGED